MPFYKNCVYLHTCLCIGQLYGCEDEQAVITGGDWIMSCPPTDQVVSRSPQVHKESPVLQPTAELGESLKIFKLFSRKNDMFECL